MSDVLEAGSNWLQQQRKQHASREVTYRRSSKFVKALATVGRTQFEQDDGTGAIIRTEVRDYLIDVDDLLLGGDKAVPERGDRIEEVDGDQRFIYEVVPMGSEPHWRYSDPYRTTFRIHTKHIDTEAI